MKNIDLVNKLVYEKKWTELEILFSSKVQIEEKDGESFYVSFFKNNNLEAIVLAEKYYDIDQFLLLFYLNHSSSSFRYNLAMDLMKSNCIRTKDIFSVEKEKNFQILNSGLIFSDVFQVITNFQIENSKDFIFNQAAIKGIFLKEDKYKNIFSNNNKDQIFHKDFLNLIIKNTSTDDSFIIFNSFIEYKQLKHLKTLISQWKKNVQYINVDSFNKNIKEGVIIIEKKLKHPFTKKDDKLELTDIFENLKNIQYFLNSNNKKINVNNNRNKI